MALALGGFQFITKLRNGYPKLHRGVGQAYVLPVASADFFYGYPR